MDKGEGDLQSLLLDMGKILSVERKKVVNPNVVLHKETLLPELELKADADFMDTLYLINQKIEERVLRDMENIRDLMRGVEEVTNSPFNLLQAPHQITEKYLGGVDLIQYVGVYHNIDKINQLIEYYNRLLKYKESGGILGFYNNVLLKKLLNDTPQVQETMRIANDKIKEAYKQSKKITKDTKLQDAVATASKPIFDWFNITNTFFKTGLASDLIDGVQRIRNIMVGSERIISEIPRQKSYKVELIEDEDEENKQKNKAKTEKVVKIVKADGTVSEVDWSGRSRPLEKRQKKEERMTKARSVDVFHVLDEDIFSGQASTQQLPLIQRTPVQQTQDQRGHVGGWQGGCYPQQQPSLVPLQQVPYSDYRPQTPYQGQQQVPYHDYRPQTPYQGQQPQAPYYDYRSQTPYPVQQGAYIPHEQMLPHNPRQVAMPFQPYASSPFVATPQKMLPQRQPVQPTPPQPNGMQVPHDVNARSANPRAQYLKLQGALDDVNNATTAKVPSM
ncbi:MAG: hypothetical protein LBG48_00050 [Rickettsiales bacterium]|jgi:hypothetical protein|nr:hypothetical protein [Rickettsiales bacterium]